jgi:glucose-6-phosphate 1-dehydrogenase
LRGDHTLFVSAAETEIAWSLFTGLLDKGSVSEYPQGKLPQSKLDVKWIDFDKYVPFCT